MNGALPDVLHTPGSPSIGAATDVGVRRSAMVAAIPRVGEVG